MVKLIRDYADENSSLIFRPDSPTTNPLPLGYSRCTGHRDNQEPPTPGLYEFVLCTILGLPTGSHRNRVAHPFTTHRTVLTSGELTGTNFKHI